MIEQLRGQGFVRARIDGIVVELDAAAEARSEEASTRSKRSSTASRCAPTSAQRLAESFETALRLSDGVARVVVHGRTAKRDELVFSDQFACPICGYSLAELEPRLFSFNNPAGACPTCSGLGVQQFFDPARVVHHHAPVARRRRDPRLGSPQRLLLPADAVAGAALQVRHRGALAGPAGEAPEGRAVRQRRRQDRLPLRRRARRHDAPRAQVGRRDPEPGAPLPRNRIARRARGAARST